MDTLANRQRIQKTERHGQQVSHELNSRLHPSTIMSIVQSRKHGDSDEQIIADYNLDTEFLVKLGNKLSIVDPPTPIRSTTIHDHDEQAKSPDPDHIRPRAEFKSKSINI